MMQSLDMSGQVVLVTGGSRGIGRGIASAFLAAGAEVVICARQVPESLPEHGGRRASYLQADVRDSDACAGLVAGAVAAHGRLDVLVNNAGGSPQADAASASPRFSAAILELNLMAPLNLSQQANAVMQGQPEGGSIIQIASVSGTRASPRTAAYGAAKAGLLNLTRSLALEWAPKVRVNAVCPGLVATEEAETYYGGEERLAALAATIPLGRLGTPEDVAGVCLFLASPWARYVSGASIVVDGGGESPAFLAALSEGFSEG